MKRNSILIGILVIFAAALVSSCNISPQKKAEVLIKDAVQKKLVLPDTYQAVETLLDSAFSPQHSPEFINLMLDVYKKGNEMDRLDAQMRLAKSSMAIWGGSYMSAYDRQQYKDAKDTYDNAKKQYDLLTSQLEKKAERMREMLEDGNEYIGVRAHHTYRAQDNAGNVSLNEEYFLLDKNYTQIIARWSKDEIDTYNQVIQLFNDQLEAAEK